MKNEDIIKLLKNDFKELKDKGFKPFFKAVGLKGGFKTYSIYLMIDISEGENCFNKTIREVEFKTRAGIIALMELMNNNGLKI